MVIEKVTKLIADQLNKPIAKVLPETDIIKDLGADSLDVVELIINLETTFNITVEDSEVAELRTVKNVADKIEFKLSKKK